MPVRRLLPLPARLVGGSWTSSTPGLLLGGSPTQVSPQLRLQMDQVAKSWLWGRQIRQEVSMRAVQPFGEGSQWLYVEAFICGTEHLTEPDL